jgi:hypothetical protein
MDVVTARGTEQAGETYSAFHACERFMRGVEACPSRMTGTSKVVLKNILVEKCKKLAYKI